MPGAIKPKIILIEGPVRVLCPVIAVVREIVSVYRTEYI